MLNIVFIINIKTIMLIWIFKMIIDDLCGTKDNYININFK